MNAFVLLLHSLLYLGLWWLSSLKFPPGSVQDQLCDLGARVEQVT